MEEEKVMKLQPREFEHPRFGVIMSVVALRDLRAGEEVFVSYNYCLGAAPPW